MPHYYGVDILGVPALADELAAILGPASTANLGPVVDPELTAPLLPGFLPGADAIPGG